MAPLHQYPDLILYNARVLTQNDAQPRAQAVAIRDGRILAVGDNLSILELRGASTHAVNCDGKTLLPGLHDSHIHFGSYSLYLSSLPLAKARSRAEMYAMVAERAAQTKPGAWITGQGWNESWWGESVFPSAAELDIAAPNNPVLLYRADMHSAVANSAALAIGGITRDTQDPPMGVIDRDELGNPTGMLKEHAANLVDVHVPASTVAQRLAASHAGMKALHSLGITAIHDNRIGSAHGTTEDEGQMMWQVYQMLRDEGALKLRVNSNIAAHNLDHAIALGLRSGFGDDNLRIGHIKLFSDGSLGSRTAWMIDPFARQPGESADNYGVIVTETAEVAEITRKALAAGFSMSIHAIGDRANREVLDVYEEATATWGAPRIPHRIEHVQTLHPDDWGRLAAMNVSASVQPIHALDDMDTADLLLGARASECYVFKSLLDAGTRLAFGSDAPVADPNPWIGIHAAVVRQRPERASQPAWHGEQRISLEAALRAYTLSAAESAGWQDAIGSIAPGKRADLVLASDNLESLTAFHDVHAAMTVFNGQIVYEA